MKSIIKIFIRLLLVAITASGCNEEKIIFPEELTGGFWMEDVTDGLLLGFEDDGSVSNYIYREHPEEGIYYAYTDPAWAQYNKYLLDNENYVIFILPDRWYNIQLLNDSSMRLDDGEKKYNFDKLWENEDLVMVDYEQFRNIFPEHER